MKREYLKGLGLSDELIDQIMAEHGRTVNEMKQSLESTKENYDQLQQQLTERDKQLDDLKKQAGENEDMKATIDRLKQQNDAEKQELLDRMNRQTLDFAVEKTLMENKVRVPRAALMAVLESPDAIQLGKDGDVIGLSEQLDKAKEAYPFMFDLETPAAPADPKPSGYNPGPPNQFGNKPPATDAAELGKLKALERHKKPENNEEVKQ